MSGTPDETLVELVAQEQRDFRRLLFAGFFALAIVAVVSIGTSVYLFRASNHIESEIERFKFQSTRDNQQQQARMASLQSEARRLYREFRNAQRDRADADPKAGLAAAKRFLAEGRLPFQLEVLIDAVAATPAAAPNPDQAAAQAPSQAVAPAALTSSERGLLLGANGLLSWTRSEEVLPDGAFGSALPAALEATRSHFVQAARDPALKPAAQTGLAWITFLDAQSRGRFAAPACAKVIADVDGLEKLGPLNPQALYWRAQCRRKSGLYVDSMRDYLSLVDLVDHAESQGVEASSEGLRTLQMNAFHGLGTQLIATFDRADSELGAALDVARKKCGPAEGADGSKAFRMALARACLDKAVELRKSLGQTLNDQAGTLENENFAYLRVDDFNSTFRHSSAVRQQALLAWNELAQALAAQALSEAKPDTAAGSATLSRSGAAKAAKNAERNVSFFSVDDFAVCELKVLLNADLYANAVAIIEKTHPKQPLPACASRRA